MKRREIVRQFATQLINTGHDQLPMSAILQPCILANLFVVLVACEMHSQNRVIVIGTGEFRCRIRNQHLDQLFHVDASRTDYFDSDPLSDVAMFDYWRIFFLGHGNLPFATDSSARLRQRSKI